MRNYYEMLAGARSFIAERNYIKNGGLDDMEEVVRAISGHFHVNEQMARNYIETQGVPIKAFRVCTSPNAPVFRILGNFEDIAQANYALAFHTNAEFCRKLGVRYEHIPGLFIETTYVEYKDICSYGRKEIIAKAYKDVLGVDA